MWWWRVVSLVIRDHDDGKHEADTSAHAMRCVQVPSPVVVMD